MSGTLSNNSFKPRVIIRTSIGSKKPLNGGVQHTQDYTNVFKKYLNRNKCCKFKKFKIFLMNLN